ncbi:MAG: hypothetical protein HRT38_09635 [Alteromonadaceae bacterium]|nr:hypothetical protein [Alteromonadaceae bacterium]
MKSPQQIKQLILKKWQSYFFHKDWLQNVSFSTESLTKIDEHLEINAIFPYLLKLEKITDKQMLHQFSEVTNWIEQLKVYQAKHSQYFSLNWQEVNFRSLGKQKIPCAIIFDNIECLARFLGGWQQWQSFTAQTEITVNQFPLLIPYLQQRPAELMQNLAVWPQLLSVCQYFIANPKPNCYLRELSITGIDTKFIGLNKGILKKLLDQILAADAINKEFEKLTEQGFEKRFGLKFSQPRIRFRVLDQSMTADLGGFTDLEVNIDDFAKLEILCDKVYITENKTNGLAFPQVNNAIVIFGLGYGISVLKNIAWLKQCRLYYWGDIDTHGFAILAQARSYLPKLKSFLMDETTLLICKEYWGQESVDKRHQAEHLPQLTTQEQKLYQQLKSDHFCERLRLEQERIPFEYWQQELY